MSDTIPPLSDLETRFREPAGWRWDTFKNPQGRTLRFGSVMPAHPDAVIIGLQGLSEFTEKYFEIAHTLSGHNCGFYMLDWQGQGHSDRHLPNPQSRHSNSFDEDIADLHIFIEQHIKPKTGNTPLVMLAHSMGGNIGLRYLLQQPDIFSCAALSAPMVRIDAIKNMPSWLSLGLTGALRKLWDRTYVFGGGDWHPEIRGKQGRAKLSSDPARGMIQDAWCLHDPALRVGGVTFGWLHEANISCAELSSDSVIKNIKTPCLFALAGKEHLIDNKAARHLAQKMPQARILELPEARHEIIMERDSMRNAFIDALLTLLRDTTQRKS